MWLFYYNEDDYLAVDNTLMDDHCHRRHLSSSRPTCLTPITQSQIVDDTAKLHTTQSSCNRQVFVTDDKHFFHREHKAKLQSTNVVCSR